MQRCTGAEIRTGPAAIIDRDRAWTPCGPAAGNEPGEESLRRSAVQTKILPRARWGYPHLVSRIGTGALRHIALLATGWPREGIIAAARAQAQGSRVQTAACFGPDDAEHVAFDKPGPGPARRQPAST